MHEDWHDHGWHDHDWHDHDWHDHDWHDHGWHDHGWHRFTGKTIVMYHLRAMMAFADEADHSDSEDELVVG